MFGAGLFVCSLERLVPVLMTALVAALALVPLTLTKDAPGKEILYPVATVILGGLLSSTSLDIVVTPVVFWLFGERALAHYQRGHHQVSLDVPPPDTRRPAPHATR